MFKRLTWLATAMLVFSGGALVAHGAESMDRHLAPDEYKTNTVKILRTTNKAQTNSYVPVVFTMRNNNPFNVIRQLRRPVEQEEGLLFTFVSPEGNGGKVLFVVPEYMVESLGELVRSVDIPGLTTSSGTYRNYIALKHRRASSTDSGFISTVSSFSTGNGSTLITDPAANSLYWEDAPSGGEALDGALSTWLDVPTAMVQLIVKIYELESANDSSIGLDYMAWKNGPGADLFAAGAYSDYASVNRADGTFQVTDSGALGLPRSNFQASGYNYAYRYNVSSAFFDFLQVKGKARLMNQMKMAVLNSYTGSLSASDELLYYAVSTSDPSGIRDGGEPFDANQGARYVIGDTGFENEDGDFEVVETGLSMEITPTIGEESIQMDISVEWSDYTGFDSTGFPQINSRNLNTLIISALGDEVVLGGLNRQAKIVSSQKVPILGSLPLLGYLFGGENTINKNSEMVVSITPVGVMNYDVAMDYSIDSDSQMVIDKARGDAAVELPADSWGFDQYGLDPDTGTRTLGVN